MDTLTGGPQGYAAARRSGQASSALTAGSAAGRGTPSRAPEWAHLRNELSEETHMLTKQETCLLGRGAWAESRRVGDPKRTAGHVACSLGSYREGVSFQVISSQPF